MASPTLPIPRAGRTFLSVSTITHDEDVQRTWTMHTLHAAEFDIACGRRPRDQGNGMRCPFHQPRDALGNQSHYLLCVHDTQMPVADQRQRPPALSRPASQEGG